jgi:site-specific DNA-adenine methylase
MNNKDNTEDILLEFTKFEQNVLLPRDEKSESLSEALKFRPPWLYTAEQLFPPFTYLGGKRGIADQVWMRFGADIPNYIEPFAGGLSVLLARPLLDIRELNRYRELVCDTNLLLLNFWRSVKQEDITKLIETVDFPPHEVEVLGRRRAMIEKLWKIYPEFKKIEYYDPELAGYWLYIAREWIGNRPDDLDESPTLKMVRAMETGFQGGSLKKHLRFLQLRTKQVRFFSGYWRRPLESDTQVKNIGKTGIFLDPPYLGTEGYYGGDPTLNKEDIDDLNRIYKTASKKERQAKIEIADEVREWAVEMGKDRENHRIAYCAYEHQQDQNFPDDWTKVRWKYKGGHSNQKKNRDENELRDVETVWFSPGCIKPEGEESNSVDLIICDDILEKN